MRSEAMEEEGKGWRRRCREEENKRRPLEMRG